MNVFNLIAKLTLDTSGYDRKLLQSANMSKESMAKVKSNLMGVKNELLDSFKASMELFAQNKIGHNQLSEDISSIISKLKTVDSQLNMVGETSTKATGMAKVGWLAVATAVIAVIKKVAELSVETMKYADNIGDMAEKWGFANEEIQEFDYWATQNGTTLDNLMTGIKGLVNQAEAGSSAFEKLGVSVRDNNGQLKDQRTLFLETATALQNVENQTERNALQFEIFGRSGAELGQIINKSGEELEALSQKARDYGLIISDEAIKKSSDFNDELDTLGRQFKSFLASMVTGDADAEDKFDKFLDNLLDKIENSTPKFINLTIKLVTKLFQVLIEMMPRLPQIIIDALSSINWLQIGWDLGKSILKGMWESLNPANWFKKTKTVINNKLNNFDEFINTANNDLNKLGGYANSSTSSISSDNYSINIEMNSTNYAQEDAKRLANDVIKQIATQKQARGK